MTYKNQHPICMSRSTGDYILRDLKSAIYISLQIRYIRSVASHFNNLSELKKRKDGVNKAANLRFVKSNKRNNEKKRRKTTTTNLFWVWRDRWLICCHKCAQLGKCVQVWMFFSRPVLTLCQWVRSIGTIYWAYICKFCTAFVWQTFEYRWYFSANNYYEWKCLSYYALFLQLKTCFFAANLLVLKELPAIQSFNCVLSQFLNK